MPDSECGGQPGGAFSFRLEPGREQFGIRFMDDIPKMPGLALEVRGGDPSQLFNLRADKGETEIRSLAEEDSRPAMHQVVELCFRPEHSVESTTADPPAPGACWKQLFKFRRRRYQRFKVQETCVCLRA